LALEIFKGFVVIVLALMMFISGALLFAAIKDWIVERIIGK
jgi:hypothetical protein